VAKNPAERSAGFSPSVCDVSSNVVSVFTVFYLPFYSLLSSSPTQVHRRSSRPPSVGCLLPRLHTHSVRSRGSALTHLSHTCASQQTAMPRQPALHPLRKVKYSKVHRVAMKLLHPLHSIDRLDACLI